MALAVCTIPGLVEEYPALKKVDKIDAQSIRVLALAAILSELGGTNYSTNICALAEQMRAYDGLPDYDLQAANLAAYAELAEAYGITPEDVTSINVQNLISCGHCCQITPRSMQTAETYLLCQIAALIRNTQ